MYSVRISSVLSSHLTFSEKSYIKVDRSKLNVNMNKNLIAKSLLVFILSFISISAIIQNILGVDFLREQFKDSKSSFKSSITQKSVDNEISEIGFTDLKNKENKIEINDTNFDLYYANPQYYLLNKINITGKIFNIIASDGDFGGIQIYHSGNQGKDLIITYRLNVIDNNNYFSDDDCVRINGTAGPLYKYPNAFGINSSSHMILADSISKIDCLDMAGPNTEILNIEQTIERNGIQVTLHKVEVDDKSTKAFLTVYNTNDDEDETISFHDTYDAVAYQGKNQFEAQSSSYSSSNPHISSRIPAGIEEKGVIVFEPLPNINNAIFQFKMNMEFNDYYFVFNTMDEETNDDENEED